MTEKAPTPTAAVEHFDVLVLGGGISGLSAAHYLAQQQPTQGRRPLRVALLEAQNRLGGRIHTADFGHGYVELGANWCHGASQDNCLFNLINTFRLLERPLQLFDRSLGAFLHSSGTALNQELAHQLYKELKKIEYSTVKLDPSERRTLDEYINDHVADLKKAYPAEEHRLIDSAVAYAKEYMQLHGGDSVKRQSAWGLGAYLEIDGDVPIKGGFRSLLSQLVAEMESKVSIRLGEEITNIDWSQKSISVKSNGHSYTAQCVLVTFSLGVLKATHKHLFVPPLPAAKQAVIQRLGFGRLTKLYLAYERPFWQPGTLNCLKFYPDLTDQQRVSTRAENPIELIRYINGFEEIPSSDNVLLAWITGDATERVSSWSSQYLAQQCTELLRLFTGDPSIPTPSSVMLSSWNENPFIRGSYMYPSMCTESHLDFALLGEPLVNEDGSESVFFSGEATHPFYYSAAHGARLTGLQAAEKMLQICLTATT